MLWRLTVLYDRPFPQQERHRLPAGCMPDPSVQLLAAGGAVLGDDRGWGVQLGEHCRAAGAGVQGEWPHAALREGAVTR